jgi:putative hemolysin
MSRTSTTAALLVALLIAGSAPALAQSPGPAESFTTIDLSAARSVCEEKAGRVQVREAMFGTNGDPSTWVDLGRSIELCRFEAADGSRIYVDTGTLAAEGPTLASVAYLSQVPMDEYDPSAGNPATAYCGDLAGSSAYGAGASGGGWVNTSDPVDTTVAMCVFPDGSMIDEWGLAYHSEGVVQGIDLALEFGYQPADGLPPVF